ncbi:MAG: hypothetical protein LBN21_00910 [Treponema sp.]|jgi:hypothetical protein|nr:hypothetical protein [Treponema sp.]
MLTTDPQSFPTTLVLTEDEDQLVWEVEDWLHYKNPADAELVRERFQCLNSLGTAVSQYPSVRNTQLLHGEARDEEKLIEALCGFSSASHLLHIPTKVVAVRSFLVAKFHAFSLLSYLVREISEFYIPTRKIIFSVICTLMAEDVYFSCLEDEFLSHDTKVRLTHDLISLWDSGIDPRAIHHLPALINLWIARDEAPPVFGTMDGTSELLRISFDMGDDWRDFLIGESLNNETRWALEEFLFGLSYEEIVQVRSRLARFGVSAVGYDEIRSYLGSKPSYALVRGDNPRGIYDFFIDRRAAGLFRKRISAPGPRRTLEEIYLKFRILLELK